MSAWKLDLDELKREAVTNTLTAEEVCIAEGKGPIAVRIVRGWRVLLSRTIHSAGPVWLLSAQTHPTGRIPQDGDGEALADIAEYIGAPEYPVTWSDDNRDPIHWTWPELTQAN